jgi:hypothetical protein
MPSKRRPAGGLKQLRRWLFRIAAALSLLLCIGAVVLWVWSYQVREEVIWRPTPTLTQRWIADLRVCNGRIELDYVAATRTPPVLILRGVEARWRESGVQFVEAAPSNRLHFPRHYWLGFGWNRTTSVGQGGVARVFIGCMPLWAVMALLLNLTLLLAWGGRPSRDHPDNCVVCSYNLTGNTSGTCPECGTPIPSSAASPDAKSPRPV